MAKSAALRKNVEQALHVIRPQPRQELFLSSSADIAIFGGSAFGGKTFALLMDPLRYREMPGMAGAIFRRTMKQADNPGGLWDESCMLYAPFGAVSFVGPHEHRFARGMTVKLAGMEMETDRFQWDGSQIPLLGFDQLEHFTWAQFWYMVSRNRDPSGRVRPYTRATCNPDPDSWLAKFIAWWIDPDTGYAIPERAGALRWMVRLEDDSLAWGNSREELLTMGHGNPALPVDHAEQPWLSVTFIYSTIYDNALGMARDPGYLAKLKNLARVERGRLLGDSALGGNWKIRAAPGLLFKREWCRALPAAPADLEAIVRGWDFAATEPSRPGQTPKAAWTVGVKLGRYRRKAMTDPSRYVILDVRRGQLNPLHVEETFVSTAFGDGRGVRISLPQDPGQAGKGQAQRFVGLAAGYDARSSIESGDKVTRFNPFSAQAEAGNVDYVAAPWNDVYLGALEAFPDAGKDDADATSRAFDELTQYGGLIDVARGAEVGESSVLADEGAPWNLS